MKRYRTPQERLSADDVRRWRVPVAIALGVVLALAGPVAASGAKSSTGPGAPGIGDEYFPDTGNGGYDVLHYGLNIGYEPASDVLTGLAVVTARATQSLTSFTLDLDGLEVRSVTVNGARATWTRSEGELRITPRKTLHDGLPFIATIRYSGVPQPIEDVLGTSGFLHTDDGTVVAGQPLVASTWFPANDHPSDKALYSVRITVPKGVEAVSNGRLLWKRDTGDSSIWFWNTNEPMASYLATATIGQFDIDEYQADGIRYWDAIDPDLMAPPIVPHSGTAFAYSGQADDAYKRLARTVAVPADDPRLSFWIDRSTEEFFDYVFVEILPEDGIWRTLPDEEGILEQDAGFAPCSDLLEQHPFLGNYLREGAAGSGGVCDATGFWAADASSDGWEEWSFDLSGYADQEVYISITYMSDFTVQSDGVAIDDIEAPGGVGSTSFEEDGDVMDGWTVPGPPEGSPGNQNDWTIGSDGPPPLGATAAASLARQPEIVAFLEQHFGAYPFDELGGIVDDIDGLGFALENQTRPIYAKEFFGNQVSGDFVVVHEIAHQWFGNSVTLERWKDIWLNEGFATYAEWLWSEEEGLGSAQEIFDFYSQIPAEDEFWNLVIGDPGPEALFAGPVYGRGAMTLHALRGAIGDEVFFDLVRTWHAQHANANATTDEFIALAEQLSGQVLDEFFATWLFTPERPVSPPAADQRAFGTERAPKLLLPPHERRD